MSHLSADFGQPAPRPRVHYFVKKFAPIWPKPWMVSEFLDAKGNGDWLITNAWTFPRGDLANVWVDTCLTHGTEPVRKAQTKWVAQFGWGALMALSDGEHADPHLAALRREGIIPEASASLAEYVTGVRL